MLDLILTRLFRVVILCVVLVPLGYLGWTVGSRDLPLELLAAPELQTPNVKAGEEARVLIKFIVHEYCPTHTDTFLFDSTDALVKQESFDYESGQAPVGKPSEFVLPIPVPLDMPGGLTTFRAITTYQCNWSHRWWPLRPPPFEVKFNTQPVSPEEIEDLITDELRDLLLEQSTK